MKSIVKKVKQVDPQKYNKEYFESVYSIYDFSQKIDLKDKEDFCWPISELIKLTKKDVIVDFGCGVGHLSFYLYLKYACKVIGVDYAKDAIIFCNKNKKKFFKAHNIVEDKIKFLNNDNENLPNLRNIKVVYLQDVIEHLYDEEIDKILQIFKSWNSRKIYIAIRTDNNLYIKYVRPFIDLFSLVTRKKTLKELKESTAWERERHVNLTTVSQLTKILKKNAYKVERSHYAHLTLYKVRLQLGKLGDIKLVLYSVYFVARIIPFLRPTFYLLASHTIDK